MNWLAHLVLGGNRPETRLGSLLADTVRRQREGLPDDFLEGMRRHRRVDAYMEGHPAVRASRGRITSIRGRYAPIAVDFLYDHLLVRDWMQRHPDPLSVFVDQFEADVVECALNLPEAARGLAEWIVASGTLRDYASESGMRLALERYGARMSHRLGTPVDLVPCLSDFEANERGFADDFAVFWRDIARVIAEEFPERGA
ncbi:MAG: ACP phosphodiesterase [Armatimonadota bacterium]